MTFDTASTQVAPADRLYLFSDGVYEITRPDGSMWTFTEFVEAVRGHATDASPIERIIERIESVRGPEPFEDDVSLVTMSGKLDAETAGTAEAALQAMVARGTRSFVVEMSGVTYVSSAGLRVVLTTAKQCGAQGGQLRLAGLTTSVRQIFDISGLLLDRGFAVT